MTIKGFQGTSLLDFPGRIASLVFYGGCNLRCPYCHNPALIEDCDALTDYPREALLAALRQRAAFIDGVVISGGEPTLAPDLLDLLREIRTLQLEVKLDTNGLRPQVIRAALKEGLVDYVAVDIKTLPSRYGELGGEGINSAAFIRGLHDVIQSGVNYEFRTTCVPGWVDEEGIEVIGETIRGARRWVLQQFVPQHSLDNRYRDLTPYPGQELRRMGQQAEKFVDEVVIRGV